MSETRNTFVALRVSSDGATSRNFVSSGRARIVFVSLQSSSALIPLPIIVVCLRKSVSTALMIDLINKSPVRDLWNTIRFFERSVLTKISSKSLRISFHSRRIGYVVREATAPRFCEVAMRPLMVSRARSQFGFDSSNAETSNCG